MSVDQNVPLGPVDRRHASRSHRRPRHPALFDTTLALGLLGVLLAGAGLGLGMLGPRVDVSVTAQAYRVGPVRLAARGDGVYQGGAGVVVLRDAGTALRGAASATTGGQPMTARCQGRAGHTERCTFQIGDRTLHAVDTWRHTAWSRVYDGGRRVQLVMVRGAPAPVPIPVDAP